MKHLSKTIRKGLLTTALLSFAFTSCSEDDQAGSSKKDGIKFSTKVEVKTSSINVQLPAGQTIGLFLEENATSATNVYKQNLLYTADGEGNLSGETQQYPQNGNSIRISAYHPYSDAANDVYTFSVAQNQVPDENNYASDLLFCSEFVQTPTNEPVILSFRHKLSLITYKLTAGQGNPDLTGAKVSALNVATSVGFNRKTGELGAISNAAEVSFGSEGGIIVPQRIAAGKQLLKIQLASGEEMYYVPNQNLNLESGKKYTFNLNVNKTTKVVSANLATVVEDWVVGFEMQGEANEKTTLRTDIKLGAYFFGAWWEGSHHISGSSAELPGKFPERESILGWANCNTREDISRQIDLAKNGGLSFFCFDWYQAGTSDHKTRELNKALQYFKEVNNGRMQYCILAVNDPANGTYEYTTEVWNTAKKYWIEELVNPDPNYLRIDGKPILVFYIGKQLLNTLAGGNTAVLKRYIDDLRAEIRAAGGPEVLLAACNYDIGAAYDTGFDIITQYNLHVEAYKAAGYTEPAYKNPVELDSRYLREADINHATKFINNWNTYPHLQKIQYIPVATTGWDTRSTLDNRGTTPYFSFGEEQVYTSVSTMIKWIDENNGQRYTTKDKVGFIFAWNEYNEGAWLLPQKNGANPLNGVRRALTK